MNAARARGALLTDRIALLDRRGRTLVACAALLGYRFESRVAAACCGFAEDVAVRRLAHACDVGILAYDPLRRCDFRFRHALYRAAVRDAIGVSARRRLHARIAAVLVGER